MSSWMRWSRVQGLYNVLMKVGGTSPVENEILDWLCGFLK